MMGYNSVEHGRLWLSSVWRAMTWYSMTGYDSVHYDRFMNQYTIVGHITILKKHGAKIKRAVCNFRKSSFVKISMLIVDTQVNLY